MNGMFWRRVQGENVGPVASKKWDRQKVVNGEKETPQKTGERKKPEGSGAGTQSTQKARNVGHEGESRKWAREEGRAHCLKAKLA